MVEDFVAKKSGYDDRDKLLTLATSLSIIVALILVIIKVFAWLQTGSVALFASLLDSILDVIAAVINFIFIRSALKPADKDHRFGHGKAEPIGGMFQAMIIGASALFLLAESIRLVMEPVMPENTTIGIIVMVIASVLVSLLVVFQRHVAKRTGSMIVSGDALHGFGDVMINLGALAALYFSVYLNQPLIDPLIAMLLTVILFYGAWRIGYHAIHQLMDTEFSEMERRQVRELAIRHHAVNDIHDLRTRRAGFSSFIQFHLEMDGNMKLVDSHRIADEVELLISEVFPDSEILIHQDPKGFEEVDKFLRS